MAELRQRLAARGASTEGAGVEFMHMIRQGQFMQQGCSERSFANQFYALARKIRPV